MPARYAVPQAPPTFLPGSRIIRVPATPAGSTLTPSGLDRSSTRALGTITVTATSPPRVGVAFQGASNTSQVARPAPTPGTQDTPRQSGPAVFVFVYAAPPIFNVIVPGGTNQGYKYGAVPQTPTVAPKPSRTIVKPAAAGATTISPAGLDRSSTRALGAPLVNPKLAPASLTHTRTLGSPTASQGAKRALGALTVTIAWIARPDGIVHVRLQGDPTARGLQTVNPASQDHSLRGLGIPVLSGRALPDGLVHTRALGTIEVNLITLIPTSLDRVT